MPQPFADELRSIQFSPKLSESLERARVFAREQSHRAVLLEHLLLALTEDADAATVMQVCNVDPVRLGTDASGYLGRLLEDMRAPAGVEPQADAELLRVLQAAGQAAQQSRRRQIDGAIVLAAIVGDGKSPAAGLLKAHGLTFEEAIRALQKATTTANAKARSQLYAAPAKSAPQSASPPAAAAVEPGASPALAALGEEAAQTPQSVDEILAAARTRIQQRTAAMVAKPEAKAPQQSAPAPAAEAGPLPLSALTSGTPAPPGRPTPAEEPEDSLDGPKAGSEPPSQTSAPSPGPPPPQPPSPARSSWTPPAAPQPAQSPPGRMPPPSPRPPAGPPSRPLTAGEGPPRPQMPQGRRPPQGGPPPGYGSRPQQVPWPPPPQPGPPPGPHPGPYPGAPARPPPGANGAGPDAALQPPARPRPGQRPSQHTGGQGGGPLVETIPRRMRVGKGSSAQVRIARDKIDGLILLLMSGRGMAHRPDAFVTRALSVRLRAPDGGFAVEPGSPETQWVETGAGLQHDEFVSWRWTVTPQWRGRGRLLLAVTARTVGHDGLATETAPPDRTIEVVVTGGRLRRLMRWFGLLAVLLLGMGLGRFANELWTLGTSMLKRLIG